MKSLNRFAAMASLLIAILLQGIPAAQASSLENIADTPEVSPYGPYELLSSCEARGNRGMENGEWGDYDCTGYPGAWFVQPM